MFKAYREILVVLLIIFATGTALSAPTVKASLDSTQILMGRLATLRLEVTQEKGVPGGFPLFSGADKKGYVTVCGDSVELRTSYRRDTVEEAGGKIRIKYEVPVQVFDSGFYKLPEFLYVCGRDSARSNSVSLKVIPVAVTADAQISDYAPTAEPEGKSIFDNLPDWMVEYWWLLVIILALILGIIWGWRRYRTKGFIIPKKPEPLPYDVAIKNLTKLKSENLWEQGMDKEYFTRLTDILRIYLEKRFGINAVEMTTPQIVERLNENPAIKDKRDYVRRILDTADYVKFAKVRPLPEDNIAAYESALKFVEETKPTAEEIEAYKASLEAAEEVKQNKGTQNLSKEKKAGKTSPLKISRKPKQMKKKGGRR
ncbi:MAG: hypothetical protein HDS70_08240 [Bacteroidales bacterium]|nr:hypothetical protein [Bacteroidales bacterium]